MKMNSNAKKWAAVMLASSVLLTGMSAQASNPTINDGIKVADDSTSQGYIAADTVYTAGDQVKLSVATGITIVPKDSTQTGKVAPVTGGYLLDAGSVYTAAQGTETIDLTVKKDTEKPTVNVRGFRAGETVTVEKGHEPAFPTESVARDDEGGSGIKDSATTASVQVLKDGVPVTEWSGEGVYTILVNAGVASDNVGNTNKAYTATLVVKDSASARSALTMVSGAVENNGTYYAKNGSELKVKAAAGYSVVGGTLVAGEENTYTVSAKSGALQVQKGTQTYNTNIQVALDDNEPTAGGITFSGDTVNADGQMVVDMNSSVKDTATDEGVGIDEEKSTVTIDGVAKTIKATGGVVAVGGEGTKTVTYHWVDKLGNATDKTLSFIVTDKTEASIRDGKITTSADDYLIKSGKLYVKGNGKLGISFTENLLQRSGRTTIAGERVTRDSNGEYVGSVGVGDTVELTNLFGIRKSIVVNSTNFVGANDGWDKVAQDTSEVKNLKVENGVEYAGARWFQRGDQAKISFDVETPTGFTKDGIRVNGKTASEGGYKVTVKGKHVEVTGVNGVADNQNSETFEVEATTIMGITSAKAQASIKIDNTAPQVTRIQVNGADVKGTGDKYTYFFMDGGSFDLDNDEALTKVEKYDYTLHEEGGKDITGTTKDGFLAIPAGFRGYISKLTATDLVGNTGDSVASNGVISETVELAKSNNSVRIIAPEGSGADRNGNTLYKTDPTFGVEATAGWSGIAHAEADVDGSQQVEYSGKGIWEKIPLFKNLIRKGSTSFTWSKEGNNQTVNAQLTDNAGQVSKGSLKFGIDKTAPKIAVEWNQTHANGLYNTDRVATIRITDINASPEKTKVEAAEGVFSGWKYTEFGLEGTVIFSKDTQNARLTVTSTDLAGNTGVEFKSEDFKIDKTKPVMTVEGNGTVRNGKYYNIERTFTVRVVDKNFQPNGFKITGATATGWSQNGDIWTATIHTSGEGIKHFTASVEDMAGNVGSSYDSQEYIQDVTKPQVHIAGVTNGASYGAEVKVSAEATDTYLDAEKGTAVLVNNKNKSQGLNTLLKTPTAEKFAPVTIAKARANDGYYSVSAHAEDLAGNITDTGKTVFTINRYGSKYTFNNLDYNGKYNHKVGNITFTVYSYDELDTGKAKVIVTRDGKTMALPNGAVKIMETKTDDNQYRYDYTIDGSVFKSDGKYRIVIYNVSKEGIWDSSAAIDYTFIVDNTAPTITIAGVAAGQQVDSSKEVPVTVVARDSYGLNSGSVETSQGSNVELGSSGRVVTYLTHGNAITVSAVAKDKAGNVATKEIDSVSIGNTWLSKLLVPIAVLVAVSMGAWIALRRRNSKKNRKRVLN